MIELDEYDPIQEIKELLYRAPCLTLVSTEFARMRPQSALVHISNVPLGAIVSMAMRRRCEELRDNVFQPNPLLERLRENAIRVGYPDEATE